MTLWSGRRRGRIERRRRNCIQQTCWMRYCRGELERERMACGVVVQGAQELKIDAPCRRTRSNRNKESSTLKLLFTVHVAFQKVRQGEVDATSIYSKKRVFPTENYMHRPKLSLHGDMFRTWRFQQLQVSVTYYGANAYTHRLRHSLTCISAHATIRVRSSWL